MDYLFHEGEIPSGYELAFEESLFNTEGHRKLQSETGWCSFYLLDSTSKTIKASLHFCLDGSLALSPFRSPFGSLECDDSLEQNSLFDFLIFAQQRLLEKRITSIAVKHYPQIYNECISAIVRSYFEAQNYQVSTSEVSSVIPVTDQKAVSHFHRSEKRKLLKAEASGCWFQEIPLHELQIVYNFIDGCRNEKNYALSMTLDQLQKTVLQFPDRFFLFGVFLDKQLIAAAITIRVKSIILYDFYHDHNSAFDDLSPVVKLVSGIYDFCQVKKIDLLDLGTSSIGNKLNTSLLHFKTLLGGKPSPKETFQKTLL